MFERKRHWEEIYLHRSPEEVSWYQTNPQASLALIEACQLDPADPVIDIGGGASRLIDHLIRAGHEDLSVLDVSSTALAHAQARLGNPASRVHWIEADITDFIPERPYALWHDRAVFHFLTEATDRARYLAALKQALPPGGQLIIASFAIGGPQKCSGLDIVQYDADKLLKELGEGLQLLEEQAEVHRTPGGARQAFCYFRLVRS
ncbi:MAG: class I SAM-dependent methyltransferase [Candidatus Thiodiazotropha sp.]